MIASAAPGQQRRAIVRLLAVTLLLALGAADPAAADDPLDRRSTDWRTTDWQGLTAGERHWFVVGFALGWRGPHEPVAPTQLPNAEVVVERRAALTLALDAAPNTRVAARLFEIERADPLAPLEVTGETWIALEVRERLALLHGFYAGTYGRALEPHLAATEDPARIDAAFAEARRLASPHLALAPSLLFARLSDWLFYRDRRPLPLVRTIEVLADQIKGR